jgi:hypothetical protein
VAGAAAGEQADKSNTAARSSKHERFISVLLKVVSVWVHAVLESSLCAASFRVRQIRKTPHPELKAAGKPIQGIV